MTRGPLGLVVLLPTLLFAGCGVSVHVSDGDTVSTAHYREVWARDWTAIIDVSDPWNPSSSGPGVCNKGGDQYACYQTDRAVLDGLNTLIRDLRKEPVPVTYVAAHRALLKALADDVQGLEDRDSGLKPPGDNASFGRGVDELHQAATAMAAAYEKFPANDRPTPALFGPGRYFS
jgi:hypothetical protein